MLSLFNFSTNIKNLVKEKKYEEALKFFKANKSNFSKTQIGNNPYIVSNILKCLRKTKQFDAGLKFLEIYGIKINNTTNELILTSYGWFLWDKYKSESANINEEDEIKENYSEEDEIEESLTNFHYTKTELVKKIEELIIILSNLNSDYSKTLISNLFNLVLKSEKNKPAPNWKFINDFCDNFTPDYLSSGCRTIENEKNGKLKKIELASDKENWYAYKTKALFKLGKWRECFELSKEALEKINKFHHLNDIWLTRRLALSKRKLGNSKESITELEKILNKKKEWYIQKELAELYYEIDDIENSFRYAMQSINNYGRLESKVNLLLLLAKILKKKGEGDLAFKHLLLSKLLRQKEGWKIPKELKDELRNFKTLTNYKMDDLKFELQKYWRSFQPNKKEIKKEILVGEIIRIIHDNEKGKDGFLKCNNKDYYFALSSNYYLTNKIKPGTKVEFYITKSKDGKKEIVKIKKIIE